MSKYLDEQPLTQATCDVLRDNLNLAVNMALPFVASRSTLPVLECLALKNNEGRLTIMATNLEAFILVNVGAMIDSEFGVAVTAKKIHEVVDLLSGLVKLTAVKYKSGLKLLVNSQIVTDKKAGRSIKQSNTLTAIELEEFPVEPSCLEPVATMPAGELKRLIDRVLHAAATDESRPILTGGYLEVESNRVLLTTADGYRLARIGSSIVRATRPGMFLIPARILSQLSKLLGIVDKLESCEVIITRHGESQVCFEFGHVKVCAQLIDGKFPDFADVMPQTRPIQIEFNARDMLAALKTGLVMMRGSTNQGTIVAREEENEMSLVTANVEIGDNVVDMPATMEGAYLVEAHYNLKYLQDMLKELNGESARFELSSPSQPLTVMEGDFMELIMPMAGPDKQCGKVIATKPEPEPAVEEPELVAA